MSLKKVFAIILCILILFLFIAAKRSKRSAPARSGKQATELKNRIDTLEAQKVSLTARVSALENEVKIIRKQADSKFTMTAGAGAAALVIAIIIIIALAGRGSGTEDKEAPQKKGAQPGVEKHFADIEYHVLNDWQNIWFHPELIDMKLYADLKNHFEELYEQIEVWKTNNKRRDDLTSELIQELDKKFTNIEATPSVYLLASEDGNSFIEENEIKSGPYLCAHVKPGFAGGHEKMVNFYDTVTAMFGESPYMEIRKLNPELLDIKSEIDVNIRRIKFAKKLPGTCSYLKS
jgi:chaperonin cofactor prefoldin